ncbi:Asp23/Gls24 family envelope stress response protein [Actinomadura sediminis]|uniref:Asp23/Gls24 family envelope stress response protein n=1 Tax=Actinomadura sediminis TaxID=1038904 RepID=A0ABW3EMI7_9ACTN
MSQDDGRTGQGATGTMHKPPQQQSRRSDSGGSELVTQGGKTAIADVVVAKIASMAARQVGGVYAMGAGMSRALGSMRERMPGMSGDTTQGVQVQVGERQAAVDIDVVVEYGVSIPDLGNAIRRNVSNEIEHMCGLEVVEVNISVDDVHLEDEDEDKDRQPEEPRVR